MNTSLRLLRIVWGALLMAIVFYILIGERVGRRTAMGAFVFRAIALVAVVTVAMIFVVRRVVVLRALGKLAGSPEDAAAQLRWRGGYLATFALCEAVALYGFVLRMEGFTLSQVAPFYISGLVLMLYFGPRRPRLHPVGASASGLG